MIDESPVDAVPEFLQHLLGWGFADNLYRP